MPIKISVENNFLKVEGNDPERIYYERSRVSHELLPTYVQLRYDNNKLAQLDLTTLDSTNTTFASLEAIVAFLTVAGDGDTNVGGSGGGGGGGGLTQALAQAAFTAALQAQNQVEFQDILLEDANGVVYISTRQIDEETGAVTFANRKLDGTVHTPVAPVTIPKIKTPLRAEFWANLPGTGYSVGDRLERIVTESTVLWYNRTLETTLTTAPTIANLVSSIEECFIPVVVTSVANATDGILSGTTFTDSPAITVPTIDGKKANTLYVYRTAVNTASVLYAGESGVLFGNYTGIPTSKVPLPFIIPYRLPQFTLSNTGAYTQLFPEIVSVFIRNYNINSSEFVFQFSYRNLSIPNLGATQDASPQLAITEDNITGNSSQIRLAMDVEHITLRLSCVGATTPVTFRLEQTLPVGNAPRSFPIQTLSLPVGTNTAQFQLTYISNSGTYSIVPTGTFTNYSYKIRFN